MIAGVVTSEVIGARRLLAAVTFAAAVAACAPLQGHAPAPTPIPSTDVQVGWDKVGSTIVMTVGQTLLMPTSMTPFNDVLTVVGRYRGGTVFRAANAGRTSLQSDYSRPSCGARPCAQLMQISVQVVVVRTLNDPYSPALIDARSRTWLWIGQRILITTTNSTDRNLATWVGVESEQPSVIAPEGPGDVTADGATRAFRAVAKGFAAITASTTDSNLHTTWSFVVLG